MTDRRSTASEVPAIRAADWPPIGSPVGASTMSPAMAEMRAYPRYLLGAVEEALGQRVLEIGVGHGTYTGFLREQGRRVLATDIDPDCLDRVRKRFAGDDGVEFAPINLDLEESVREVSDFRADSVLCLNVLEHIEFDVGALEYLQLACGMGAKLGIVVPAHPFLFGKMDAEAGHFRRYTRSSLAATLESGGWVVERVRYLNVVGAAGWWFHNRVRRTAGLADGAVNRQMRSADAWLPQVARLTDPLFGRLAGLSVAAVARLHY